MGWMSLITALLAFLGPILEKWLATCAEKRAAKVAATLPPLESYSSQSDARRALLAAMRDDLPKWARIRKALLTRAAAVLDKHDVTTATVGTIQDVSPDDAAELRNLSSAAEDE